MIMDSAHEDANIIFGSVINPDMRDAIKVTVIATGFGREVVIEPPVQQRSRSAAPLIETPRPRTTMQPQQQGQLYTQQPQAYQQQPSVRPERATIPERAPRQAPAQPAVQPARERERGERFSFNPSDAELDIPTFLRHRNNNSNE